MFTQPSTDAATDARALQEQMIALVRAAGLHQPDRTPCGQPVPVSEAHAVLELSHNDAMTQRELTRRLRLEKSAVSRLVRQLHNRGWVSYERVEADGRVNLLSLTDDGRRAAADLAAVRSARFARVLDAIPEAERASVLQGLVSLVEAFDAE
jgi:DNA-binding MarR family transcriptional regulator